MSAEYLTTNCKKILVIRATPGTKIPKKTNTLKKTWKFNEHFMIPKIIYKYNQREEEQI